MSKLFIVSAPSGCGKTTLCNKLLEGGVGKLADSISMTTRPPRADEKNGVDYRFVSKRRFQEMIKRKAFLEYESNFGRLYGTPKKFIEKNLKKGRSVLLSIDVKGAMKVRRAYTKESVLIFILPPSLTALKKRLKERMSEDSTAMSDRLSIARREMSYKNRYDYRVVNDSLDSAYRKLKNIIIKEMKECKTYR